MSDKTEEELRQKIALILMNNIKFIPQVDGLVIHGAIDEIIKLGKDGFKELQHTKDCVHEKSNESSERFKTIIELNQELASLREQLELKIELVNSLKKSLEIDVNQIAYLQEQLKQKEDENRELYEWLVIAKDHIPEEHFEEVKQAISQLSAKLGKL